MSEAQKDINPIYLTLGKEFKTTTQTITNLIDLIKSGNSVPYIAHFQKEKIESLSELKIYKIIKRLKEIQSLESKKNKTLTVLKSLGHESENISKQVSMAKTKNDLNDLLQSFQLKKPGKATIALQKGLAPLADLIWKQEPLTKPLETMASDYINVENDLSTPDKVLEGVRAILINRISEDTQVRHECRKLFYHSAKLAIKGTQRIETSNKNIYKKYVNTQENLNSIVGQKYLAIQKGERQKFLITTFEADDHSILEMLQNKLINTDEPNLRFQLESIITDAYYHFLRIDLQNEAKQRLWEQSQDKAIQVFTSNLQIQIKQLPLGNKIVLAIWPTSPQSCCSVIIDQNGKFINENNLNFNNENQNDSESTIIKFIDEHHPEAIVFGSNDYTKNTKAALQNVLSKHNKAICLLTIMAPEAKIYTNSEAFQNEFMGLDENVRIAIYIGRKLQDPLAEIVKVEPTNLQLGPYQHDIDQQRLISRLKIVLEIAINRIGADLNTASKDFLKYISGLNEDIAKAIVDYRMHNGNFNNIDDLKKVEGITDKIFEQAQGFLRIINTNSDLQEPKIKDNRRFLELFIPKNTSNQILDLKAGSFIKGRITNMTSFGLFVDMGLNHDALIHRSQIPDKFSKNFTKVFKLGQMINAKVSEINKEKGQIQLSLIYEQRYPSKPNYQRTLTTKRKNKFITQKQNHKNSKPKKPKQSFGTLGDQFKNLILEK